MFTGSLRVKICEACGLRPTDYQKRFLNFRVQEENMNPYCSMDVDEKFIGEMQTLSKVPGSSNLVALGLKRKWRKVFPH